MSSPEKRCLSRNLKMRNRARCFMSEFGEELDGVDEEIRRWTVGNPENKHSASNRDVRGEKKLVFFGKWNEHLSEATNTPFPV